MGNEFLFIGKDNQTPEDIAERLGRLSEDLKGVIVPEDAKKQVREALQEPVTAQVLGPDRVQGIWSDVRKLEGVGDIRDYLRNVSRFVEKEVRAKESWETLSKYLGKADAEVQAEDSESEASLKELLARLVVLAQDVSSAPSKSAAILKSIKFFNEPSIKPVFGQSRVNWLQQDMRNAGDVDGVIQVIRNLINQLEKEGLPVPTEEATEKRTILQLWQNKEVKVETWFERDRAYVGIKDVKTDKEIIEWWDDDVRQAFEDGFFEKGKNFEQSVVKYADHLGVEVPSSESVVGAMVPAGGARTMGWGESFEVSQGMYKGLKGVVRKYGKFVEAEVQETWRGKLNSLPVEIMEGSVVHIPSTDIVPEAVAAGKVDINWREAEEEINAFLDKQSRIIFNLREFMDGAKDKLAAYGLSVQDLDTSEPAGEKSLKVTFDNQTVEDTHLDIKWMTKGDTVYITSSVHFPESENREKEDDLDSSIYTEMEKVIEDMANAHAAEAWSTPTDEMTDKYGEVWIMAEFGDHVAVNGDLDETGSTPNPPDGFEKTEEGGHIPTTEEAVSVEHAMEAVARKLGIEYDRVAEFAKKEWPKDVTYTSVSGDAEIWAKPKEEKTEADRVVAPKLDRNTRHSINNQLYDISRQYHKSIPLSDIRGILMANGLDIEDSILTGREGRDTFDLLMGGQVVGNSMLVLSWHKMDSGNWEINAYLS